MKLIDINFQSKPAKIREPHSLDISCKHHLGYLLKYCIALNYIIIFSGWRLVARMLGLGLYRLDGREIKHPFELGTAQADAFFAGIEEGHRIFREYEEGKSTD